MITEDIVLASYVNGDFKCTLYSSGTFTKESSVVNPKAAFPSSIDVKITNYCNMPCAYCHEDSTTKGRHGDISLLLDQLAILPEGIELAIGGGNPLAHPNLLQFLYAVKQQGKYANITINQGHLTQYRSLIQELVVNDLVKGIGVSIVNVASLPTWLTSTAQERVVLHMIAGVHTVKDVLTMLELGAPRKILVLGYKTFGRGITYFDKTVEDNLQSWIIYVRSLFDKCLLSFDNLGIEQLKLKRFFSEEMWNKLYMGDDFTHSMYIDAVEMQYAPTSRSSTDQRVNYSNIIDYWNSAHN
jgi:hypothetical protein